MQISLLWWLIHCCSDRRWFGKDYLWRLKKLIFKFLTFSIKNKVYTFGQNAKGALGYLNENKGVTKP